MPGSLYFVADAGQDLDCGDFKLADSGRERRTAAAVLDQDGVVDLGRLQAIDLLACCRDPVMMVPLVVGNILRVNAGHDTAFELDRHGLGAFISLICFVHVKLLVS